MVRMFNICILNKPFKAFLDRVVRIGVEKDGLLKISRQSIFPKVYTGNTSGNAHDVVLLFLN